MTWALFFQIEVILLTLGLVIAFVVTFHQSKKDDSFFKRIAAIGAVLSTWGESMAKKQSISAEEDERKRRDQFLKAIDELGKRIKEKEEKNDK